jgi:hypothetical protein
MTGPLSKGLLITSLSQVVAVAVNLREFLQAVAAAVQGDL